MIALVATALRADERSMSCNSEIVAVPAPGPVAIDGKTDDWDLSAGVFSYNDPLVAASHSTWTHIMWDAEGLYVLVRFRDDTPCVNATRGIDFSKSWRGDCYQARVIFDDRQPEEHQMHIDMFRSTPDDRGCIIMKHGGHKDRPPYDATGPARADQLAKWGPDMTAVGGKIAFGKWADGKGYDLEAFWPWSVCRTSGRPLAPGDRFTFGFEALWSDATGENPMHRLADGIRDDKVNRIFMFYARDGWGKVVVSAEGRLDVTERQRALHAERVANFSDYRTEGPVKIAYELPEDRDVTIAIDGPDGVRVRNLIGEYPRRKGKVEDRWDGLDDDGRPVKPGRYTATIVHHLPLSLTYRNSLYNAGVPPWRTDGKLRLWGSNHGYPTSVATDAGHTVVFFTGTEGASGMQLIDDAGRVQWADVNEFLDGTMDGTYVYGLSRSAWQNSILIQRNRLDTGDLTPFEDEQRLPNAVIVKEDWRQATDYSSLALAHGRLWALMPGYRLFTVDPATGKVLSSSGDGGLAAVADRNGRLYALFADGRVATLDERGAVATTLFTAKVGRGVRLGVDLEERRFAVTDSASNQVRILDAKGNELGAVGSPYAGERRPEGRFVETDLVRPIGAAFDHLGRLWVAEGVGNCKRVTCWDRELKLVDQYWGAADYGAMCAFPIVADASRFICHGVEFALDPAPDPRRRKTNERPLVNQPYLAHERGIVHRVNGRDYACAAPGYGNPDHLSIFMRDADQVFRPVVRIDLRRRVHRDGKWTEIPGRVWNDLNGNHAEDPGETFAVDCAGTYWANGYVRPDLAILTTDNKLFVPVRFTEAGVPVYDFEHPATTGDGQPYRQQQTSTGTPAIDRAGNVSDGISFFAADGRRGRYPNRWGRHDAPAARRGALIAPFRVNGVIEDVPGVGSVLAMGGDRGQWFLLSMDGLYLGAICQDTKGEVTLDETFIGQESFGGFFWRDGATGKPMVQIGHASYCILELGGLESVVKEKRTIDLTAADVAAGESAALAKAAKSAAEPDSLTVAALERLPDRAPSPTLAADRPLMPGAADVRIAEDGNPSRWFRAALAHDNREFAIAFQVADPSPWRNGEGRFTHLFIGGDAVDLKLEVPGVGPIRILTAPLGGKPATVFWRKRSPRKQPITYAVGNNAANAEGFDEVRRVDAAVVDVATAERAYSVLVRVPLAEVALDGKELGAGPVSGTVGVIYSDPSGNNRAARVYWHDKETGLVSDVPSESRLVTGRFGKIEWGKGR